MAACLVMTSTAWAVGDGPDTDGWKVVFADDFDRDKLGERWKVVGGDWSIDDGALKGRLRKKDAGQYEYHEADLSLGGIELPPRLEVRYETWSPDEVGSEAKFMSEAGDAGIVMAFLGVAHPAYNAKGALLFVFKEMFYRLAGRAAAAELVPRKRHKVRILRDEDRLKLFLDGKEVVSAVVAEFKDLRVLRLHLVGTWGKDGSTIFFDNLEVLVPKAEARSNSD